MSMGDTLTATTPTPDVVYQKIATPNPMESVYTTYDAAFGLTQTMRVGQTVSKTRKRSTMRLDWRRAPGSSSNPGTTESTASVYIVADVPLNANDVGFDPVSVDYMLHGLLLDVFGTVNAQKVLAGQV